MFNKVFDIVSEIPVDFSFTDITDILSVSYYVIKLAAHNSFSDNPWCKDILENVRLSCTFTCLGLKGKQWIDEKLLETRRNAFDDRVCFYSKIAANQIVLRGECLDNVLKPMASEDNPITRCTVAFFDCFLNKEAYNDYVDARNTIEKRTREFSVVNIVRVESLWKEYYSTISEFIRESEALNLSLIHSENYRSTYGSTSQHRILSPLDPVDHDILQINSQATHWSSDRCKLIAENRQYQFFKYNYELFRVDQISKKQVHIAYGAIHYGCILNDTLFYYDYYGINGNRYINCCNLDGGESQVLQGILSNKKTIIALHENCEDSVQGMVSRNNSVYIFVRRTESDRYIDFTYRLFIQNGEYYIGLAKKTSFERKKPSPSKQPLW